MTETVVQKELSPQFLEYVDSRIIRNGEGGRPHFLTALAKISPSIPEFEGSEEDKEKELQKEIHKVFVEETLNILESAWIKNRSIGEIGKKYGTTSKTIYRLLKDLESMKPELSEYLLTVPRRKRWHIPELDSSDYETIQAYINRAKRDGLKAYKRFIQKGKRAWTFFNYRDPAYWTADQVCQFLGTLSPGAQSGMLDAIRQVAPQIKNESIGVKTGRFREKLMRRKKDIFGNEVNMIREALANFKEIKTKYDLHITLGAREGSTDPRSGLAGLTWEKFKKGFSIVDLYESKVRGGIHWRDCPLDLFFKDLPGRLRDLWISRGRPTNGKLFENGYKDITAMYKEIRRILRERYEGKIDPSLLKEFITLRPHDADKIHVNLLWEAKVPLEVVAGQFIGQGEGVGLMGRGWLDINVIKKHYLSLTARSERFQEVRNLVRIYSDRFNGYHQQNGGS
jgi:hypothetical protein